MYCEELPLRTIADRWGTPCFVYSRGGIIDRFQSLQESFEGIPHLVCYALKANSNLAVLRILAERGSGADIVSGGELFRAKRAGISSSNIVFAGVGKTENEIKEAIRSRILMFNVESLEELHLIDHVAGKNGRIAPVALRVNPDIDPKTHPYISTGLRQHKFGIPLDSSIDYYRTAARLPHLKIVGIHMHLGSQLLSVSPYRDAVEKILGVLDELKRTNGIELKYLDIGGGLGIDYEDETRSLSPRSLAVALSPLLRHRNITLILEPGRAIIANAGVLLTRVLFNKSSSAKRFVVVDAGMNDFLRPVLYDAYHEIVPVRRRKRAEHRVDIVGPVCETADFFAKDRFLRDVNQGDLLAVMNAGAYGFSMSSNYNSRPRAAEILVDGDRCLVARLRETYKDLVRYE